MISPLSINDSYNYPGMDNYTSQPFFFKSCVDQRAPSNKTWILLSKSNYMVLYRSCGMLTVASRTDGACSWWFSRLELQFSDTFPAMEPAHVWWPCWLLDFHEKIWKSSRITAFFKHLKSVWTSMQWLDFPQDHINSFDPSLPVLISWQGKRPSTICLWPSQLQMLSPWMNTYL